ncbi:uncharacterized protein EKO05_0010230 [Ascochyta rabiei]|uniref:uncharacterized protein n=1 Tax=Didymella rabiei TaxID=5454 RepID=UPI00220B0C76|nr:uncharacterized protein EKO05_0010230 [Ascochyta rabiei]UPX19982.1 hypothetical protein EKO05_0010230 [Ascochyta rabiei]
MTSVSKVGSLALCIHKVRMHLSLHPCITSVPQQGSLAQQSTYCQAAHVTSLRTSFLTLRHSIRRWCRLAYVGSKSHDPFVTVPQILGIAGPKARGSPVSLR